MIDEQARLLTNREVAADFYLARLSAPHIAARIEPGQFVNIQVGAGIAPLLRVPLSVSGVDREAGIIEVLYEEVGPKTRALSQFGPDADLPTLGPLGKGFAPPPEDTRVVLVGGGIGVPPLLYWGLELRQRRTRLRCWSGRGRRTSTCPASCSRRLRTWCAARPMTVARGTRA